MATRRELLLAATGGCLIGRVWAADGAGTVAQVEALAALPGKKPLIRRSFRPPNFETPLADLAVPLTDNGAFFVRYHLAVIPRIDPDSWRLQVSGASARRPLTLSLAELRSGFEQVEVVAVNQCAGNRRALFTPRVPGVQWGGGAMGNARWRGVRLREVLQRAGVAADALEVVFGGADAPVLPATPAFVKSLPVERALDESTLVAFEMTGRPLPHWNGAAARTPRSPARPGTAARESRGWRFRWTVDRGGATPRSSAIWGALPGASSALCSTPRGPAGSMWRCGRAAATGRSSRIS